MDKISQEVIATGIALILVSLIVAKVPTLKKLVKDYSV